MLRTNPAHGKDDDLTVAQNMVKRHNDRILQLEARLWAVRYLCEDVVQWNGDDNPAYTVAKEILKLLGRDD